MLIYDLSILIALTFLDSKAQERVCVTAGGLSGKALDQLWNPFSITVGRNHDEYDLACFPELLQKMFSQIPGTSEPVPGLRFGLLPELLSGTFVTCVNHEFGTSGSILAH